jgi:hypothetical protein
MPPQSAIPAALPPEARKAVLGLYSDDPWVREFSARTLHLMVNYGEIPRADRVVPFLLNPLGDSRSVYDRKPELSVAFLKECLNYPRQTWKELNAKPQLLCCWSLPWGPETGRADLPAAAVLCLIGEPAVEPLIRVLRQSHRPMARHNAAWALGNIADARALEPLLAATRDPNWMVRLGAVSGLGAIHHRRAEEHDGFAEASLAAILAATGDERLEVRQEALGCLCRDMGAGVLGTLTAALKDPDRHVRWTAADTLSRRCDPLAMQALIEALDDPYAGVRWAAAEALGQLYDERALAPLRKAAADPDPRVRRQAAHWSDLVTAYLANQTGNRGQEPYPLGS